MFSGSIFGIPIGILGAGFEEILEEENEDNEEELTNAAASSSRRRIESQELLGSHFERSVYKLVNGIGSKAATHFEATVYSTIFAVIAIGIIQTIPGRENTFHEIEWIGVFVFTVEYLLRLVAAGADPDFAPGRNALTSRLRFMVSFYGIVDLLAIVPFYIAWALPNSIVDKYDEYLRMLRILRLLKLDKYVPSITLIDDVVRLKFASLRVAFMPPSLSGYCFRQLFTSVNTRIIVTTSTKPFLCMVAMRTVLCPIGSRISLTLPYILAFILLAITQSPPMIGPLVLSTSLW